MTDATPTPDPDDVLRQALQAEAHGVEASDALLDRTLNAASHPAVRPNRRLLAVAAVAAAVAIGAGVALARDDDQQVDSANDPSTTSTTMTPTDPNAALATLFPCQPGDVVRLSVLVDASEPVERVADPLRADARTLEVITATAYEVAAAGGGEGSAASATFATAEDELAVRGQIADLPGVAATSSTDCGGAPATPTGERPAIVALVREDGWLVTVDLETGDERELYFGGDPDAPPAGQEEGGPQFIDSVDLSPDGRWVYFSTCCEPASGTTFRIRTTGGEPTMVTHGAYPRVSPDGRHLATSACQRLYVSTVDRSTSFEVAVDKCVGHLAWSPDGRQLAAITSVGPDAQAQVLLFDWDGSALTPADPGKPDNPGSFVSWTPEGMLTITSGGPVDDDRSLSQDVSYRWLLWVDEAGVVREQAGHESSERTPLEGLPTALAADW